MRSALFTSILTLALSTMSYAGGDSTPRLVIEFFVSVDNDLSYERSSGTSTVTLNSASDLAPHRSVLGILVEEGPIDVVISKPTGEILRLIDLSTGVETSVITGSTSFTLASGRHALHANRSSFELSWPDSDDNGPSSFECPGCLISSSGDNLTLSPGWLETATFTFEFTSDVTQTIGIVGDVSSDDVVLPAGLDEESVVFPSGTTTITATSTEEQTLAALTINFASSGDSDGSGPSCASDVDGNGSIGFSDVLTILSDWGDCP